MGLFFKLKFMENKILKPGDTVLLIKTRPAPWNDQGLMDRYLGRKVMIKNVYDGGGFNIFQDEEDNYFNWNFQQTDIVKEHVYEPLIFN